MYDSAGFGVRDVKVLEYIAARGGLLPEPEIELSLIYLPLPAQFWYNVSCIPELRQPPDQDSVHPPSPCITSAKLIVRPLAKLN